MGISDYLAGPRTALSTAVQSVYLLWLDEKVVYVGRTKRLEERIVNHKESDKKFTHYSAHGFDSIVEAINVERQLIAELKPIYNKQVIKSVCDRSEAELLEVEKIRDARSKKMRESRLAWKASQQRGAA